MKEVWIQIDRHEDRNNMVIALANAGIRVRVKMEENDKVPGKIDYWIIMEVPDLNVKDLK